jgi:hypothetical protein
MKEVALLRTAMASVRGRNAISHDRARDLESKLSGWTGRAGAALGPYVVVDLDRLGTQTDRCSRVPQTEPRIEVLGGDMAKVRRTTATKEMEAGAVAVPRKAREPDWAVKIENARLAREAAKKARKGKPATFPNRLVP